MVWVLFRCLMRFVMLPRCLTALPHSAALLTCLAICFMQTSSERWSEWAAHLHIYPAVFLHTGMTCSRWSSFRQHPGSIVASHCVLLLMIRYTNTLNMKTGFRSTHRWDTGTRNRCFPVNQWKKSSSGCSVVFDVPQNHLLQTLNREFQRAQLFRLVAFLRGWNTQIISTW